MNASPVLHVVVVIPAEPGHEVDRAADDDREVHEDPEVMAGHAA